MCGKKTKTTTVCLPGTGFEDVRRRVMGGGGGGGGGGPGGGGEGGGGGYILIHVATKLSTFGKGAEGQ